MAVMSFTMKCNSIADYAEALKLGEVPVAYARVMFLGPGGSGKSSLLDGLMDQPLRLAESTALADILNITNHWVEAADAAEDAWRLMAEEDDVQELASLCHLAVKDKTERPQGAAAGVNAPVHTASASSSDQNAQKAVLIQKDVAGNVVQKAWKIQQMQQDVQQKLEELQHKQQKLQQKQLKLQQNWLWWRQRKQLQEEQQQLQQEQKQLEHALFGSGPEVMMRIWDCGGQPVFLDILSAFLTSRTMFLLLFDASQPLNKKCQESWRHKGQTYHGKEYNITFLQLMVQWMRLIHASLLAKNEMGTDTKNTTSEATQSEATQSEATTDRRQPINLPPCPRIMIVGTHGDRVSSKKAQKVLKEIESSCNERAFQDLVIDKLIIDNTTAGRGRKEDPGYRRIRKKIHEFTHSLTAPTPIAWVSFRKVVQKAAADSPVLSYGQVTTIAETCGIDKSKVPSVLHFYHQLGVYLHYKNIESLSSTIIAEPRWLIKQLCKLLMPEWYHPRSKNLANLWQWLERKGVLLEPLYQDLWGDCGLTGGAQALVDLLEHFDLARKIDDSSVSREMQRYEGCKYFVPCMLNARLQEGPDREVEKMTGLPQEFIREAITLHLTFDTGYIPPGFFVRLAVQMTKSEKCTPIFEKSTYRDSITFRYGEVDRVTITESKSLASVHVDFIRVVKRDHSISRFADSCVSFRRELYATCKEVLCWLPSIQLDFAFRCTCSVGAEEHFAIIDDSMSRDSKIFCLQNRAYKLDQKHKYWLPAKQYSLQVSLPLFLYSCITLPHILTLQPNAEGDKLTETEMVNVAEELRKKGNTSDLAWEMEVEYDPKEAYPEYAMISDWELYEKGTSHKLAEHLREAGLTRVSTM